MTYRPNIVNLKLTIVKNCRPTGKLGQLMHSKPKSAKLFRPVSYKEHIHIIKKRCEIILNA